ncbi:thiazolylpeptide-type bacteriocin [Streptosporangium sp. NPDC000396]|uniref:thiazolylpeptide-type bacteriocin n=1 Tax=Streptosporangium sp. NPDC000396 TaxID=3366185 RepID=UPI0036C504D2
MITVGTGTSRNELDLKDLTVVSIRDSAALPETGASQSDCSCSCGSSSCCSGGSCNHNTEPY